MKKTLRFSAGLLALALAAPAVAQRATFEDPVELTADGKPMRGILYPSPTLHDLNGDGKRELLIGDLRGFIQVAHAEKGVQWGALTKMKSANAKPIKLNNW